MGQIVRRKRRGRPSNTDRARINYSAAPPSPVDRRRSRRRRNVRYNFDIDDYVDDDEFYSDEDEEVGRREKKLRLLLSEDDSRPNTRRVRHAPTSSSSSSSDDYDEDDDVKHSKKRKVNARDGEDDEDNEIEEIRRKFEEEDDEEEEQEEGEEEEALGGSALDLSKGVPLPDKKTLELILDKLQKKDTYGVYAEPVDPDELPDYHDVIKHPMDFSTVRKKLAKGAYLTLKEFESDVFLICTNAMQYNAPDTIYYKQASSIQEQAKLRFQRLRANVDRSEIELNTDHKVTPSFSPPKKQLKKPMGQPVHDPIGSETLSGANVRMEEFPNGSSAQTPVRPNSSEVLFAENSSFPDNSLDKEQELVTGKGFVSKVGTKTVHDENRRATYDTSVEPVTESDSIFSIFEGESKQFIPVGLHADHSYARSLARFAATLGSVAWKVASQTIEQALPSGVKYGRGWVGEYEPLPTTVLIMPGDYTLKQSNFLQQKPSRSTSNNKPTTLGNSNATKQESLWGEEPIKDPKPHFFKFSGEGPLPQAEIITRKPDIPSPRPSPPVSLASFKHPNDGFAPGRPSTGNSTLVGREQQQPGVNDPVRMMSSFSHSNSQNDGYAPGRPCKGNPTPREPQLDPGRMMPSFNHPKSQNDGFAPGRPSKGNPTPVNREQQQQGLNDPVRMMPSFKHPHSQNDGFAPGRPSRGNPTPVSDPVEMMKMLAERSQSQSQSQQNNSVGPKREDPKRDDSSNVGGQAWMSLGGTHKQQIPPVVVDSLNSRYQPQLTRFRGEVHFQGDKNAYQQQQQQQQPVQAFVPLQHVQNNRHMGFPQLVTADLSRFQVQPSWRGGVSPQMQMQMQMQQQLRPKQQEPCPPDLNIGYHQSSPVRQSTGMLVDSQQPDLALQL